MSTATIDPWLLNMAGVSKELIRVEDFASDSVVLRLASTSTTKKLVSLDTADIGNLTVTLISIFFIILQPFAINSLTALWKERSSYIWASILWFTSFQKYISTMLFNTISMVLETVATIFLVTRKDVKTPRRLTSEANEHTYVG